MKITPLEDWIHQKIAVGREPFNREAIEAWQLQKLRETIQWARANSPFYGTLLSDFDESGLHSLKDLGRFPFTTPEDVRRNPLKFLCVSQSDIHRVVTLPTSGTTGEPKRIHFTREEQELTIDFFHHGMSTLVGRGDRVLILLPGERPGSVGDLLVKGLDRLGVVGIPHGLVKDVDATLDIMAHEKVTTLVGIPVQVLALARFGNGRSAPRNVLLSTDHTPHAIIRALESLWGCEVFTHYGMTEMGYGGGVECQAHLGYHMREADLLFEIIDPVTGSPVVEGEWGEVVLTSLTRHGMPLIRYRTGDISRFIPEKCPCGTLLKSMEQVRGRIGGDVTLGTAGVLRLPDLNEALFPLAGLLDFSATVTREGEKDCLHVDVHAMAADAGQMSERVRRVLDTLPVVRAACTEGALLVSVDLAKEVWLPLNSAAKRRIIDQRSA